MSEFTELEVAMFTKELNVRRYLNSNIVDIFKENQMATLNYPNGYGHGTIVHNECVALTCGQTPCVKVKEGENKVLRVRKLTPKEALRLMGFADEDWQALKDIGLSDAAIYHMAGDSLLTTIAGSLFQMLVDHTKGNHIPLIEKYIEENVIEERKLYD